MTLSPELDPAVGDFDHRRGMIVEVKGVAVVLLKAGVE